MADLDQAGALACQLGEHVVDPAGRRLVELGGRFVGQDQPGTVGYRGTDRDLLRLAAGQLGHRSLSEMVQTEPFKGGVRGLPGLPPGTPLSRNCSAVFSSAVCSGSSARRAC